MSRIAAVLVLAAWHAAPAAAAEPFHVTATLNPPAVLYGDPVTAEVVVDYDPKAISAGNITVQPSFIPYVVTSAPVVQRPSSGVVSFTYSLLCVTEGCLPTKGPRTLRLEPVRVSGPVGGRTVTSSTSWPILHIASRLSRSDLSGAVRFRSPATPAAPRYRLAPRPLAVGLIAAATLCFLGAVALAGRELARRRRHSTRPALSPLELAVAYVRDSIRRTDPDRRRALELLAETAGDGGEQGIATAAADTAWSKPPPTPTRAAELADRAESAAQ